jgi:hypothetical protein
MSPIKPMPNLSLARALDFIKANQNPDGGWGCRPGGQSLTEPTSFCLLALKSRGDRAEMVKGIDFLKSCQKDSGAVGIYPGDPEGSWMAYSALLAFDAVGAGSEESRLRDWILSFEDASSRFTPADIKAIAADYRYDASIRGWPWTPNTTCWVEPTALFIIALSRVGVPATEKRVKSGADLILDRRVPSGGWNFGNPYSKAYELEASTMSTALALAALGAAGVQEGRPAVSSGIRFLTLSLAGDTSTASLAWALLALNCYPTGAALAPKVSARLAGLQAADGSFRQNLFETALAFIVLSDTAILVRTPGKGR